MSLPQAMYGEENSRITNGAPARKREEEEERKR
jgi:hypothetical protein